jgi:TRAP-type C4-dicarboxylate transport system permease small subunit
VVNGIPSEVITAALIITGALLCLFAGAAWVRSRNERRREAENRQMWRREVHHRVKPYMRGEQ